jgi:hypothetical protein
MVHHQGRFDSDKRHIYNQAIFFVQGLIRVHVPTPDAEQKVLPMMIAV